jgi:5-deoxy-5-amino-3-dehydroquinate synthase
VFAAELARRLGRIDDARVKEHRAVLETYGLPTTIPADLGVDDDTLVRLMERDKKAIGGVTFVLDGPTGVEVVRGVADADVRAALEAAR